MRNLKPARSASHAQGACVSRLSRRAIQRRWRKPCALQSAHVSWLPGAPFAGSASSRQPSNISCWRFSDVSFSVNVCFAPQAAGHHFGPGMQGFAHVDCAAEVSIQNRQGSGFRSAAPVSHQKQPHQNATNAIEIEQNCSKINEADRYSAAHNGLVAGSSPAGPTNEIGHFLHGWKWLFFEPPQMRCNLFVSRWSVDQSIKVPLQTEGSHDCITQVLRTLPLSSGLGAPSFVFNVSVRRRLI